MKKHILFAVSILTLLILAACSPAAEAPDASDLPPALVLAAQAWLAERLGVEVDSVVILETEQVEWSDGCLELGRPDESCLAAITPGWLIVFEVDGESYEVHTDEIASVIRLAE
jgi:hypothetical protein